MSEILKLPDLASLIPLPNIISTAYPALMPDQKKAVLTLCYETLPALQRHAQFSPLLLRLSPHSPLLNRGKSEIESKHIQNPRTYQIPRLMRRIAEKFRYYDSVFCDLGVGSNDLDFVIPFPSSVFPSFTPPNLLRGDYDNVGIDGREVVSDEHFRVWQYELLSDYPVPFMYIHLATQKCHIDTPVPNPAELRHNVGRGLRSDRIFAPLYFINGEISAHIPPKTAFKDITLFGTFENSGLPAYLLIREFIKFAKMDESPQSFKGFPKQMRDVRRDERKAGNNQYLVFTKENEWVKNLMIKDSFLAFLLDPEGFITFLEQTGLIQHYFYLNKRYRNALINDANNLHRYMEQEVLTPEQIQQAHDISQILLRFIEPAMRTLPDNVA